MTLTPLEHEAIERALMSNRPYGARFADQLNHVRVMSRESSSAGVFVHLSVPAELVEPSLSHLDFEFGGVVAQVPGLRHGLTYIVFVRKGALDMLEGYVVGDDRWPDVVDSYVFRSDGG